jgi:uncharacterized protein involved in tolerance to divalent cations
LQSWVCQNNPYDVPVILTASADTSNEFFNFVNAITIHKHIA